MAPGTLVWDVLEMRAYQSAYEAVEAARTAPKNKQPKFTPMMRKVQNIRVAVSLAIEAEHSQDGVTLGPARIG